MADCFIKKHISNSRRIGKIKTTINPTIPEGWLLCDGSEFSQEDYPLLYEFLGSTTLPNYNGRALICTTTDANVGVFLSQALPAIIGAFTSQYNTGSSNLALGLFYKTSGAFSLGGNYNQRYPNVTGGGQNYDQVFFNARNYNSTYTGSVVRPNCIQVYYLIKAK